MTYSAQVRVEKLNNLLMGNYPEILTHFVPVLLDPHTFYICLDFIPLIFCISFIFIYVIYKVHLQTYYYLYYINT